MEHVEKILSTEGGTASLAGLLIIFCLHLILKIITMGIGVVKHLRQSDVKKLEHLTSSMDQVTIAVRELNHNLSTLNNRVVETDIIAVKTDKSLSRLVSAVKKLAGDRWSQIQREVREDEFINPAE